MKRKIFSKFLMVALVIAAVGSFVSCKDYDDDINNLQKQIDAKAALSELTALQSTLESKISTATAAAQKAAEDAAAKADASLKATLETAIADAKKAGTDAGTQAGTAIAAANKAQETADAAAAAAKKADEDAKAALADALKTIEETYQTKAEAAAAATEAAKALADVKAIADAAYTKAQAEKLQEQVDNLKADLESSIEEKVKEAIKDVQNAKASVDAIWSAVTSVEFVVAPGVIENPDVLNFQFGKQVDNVFGNGKELHSYEATDKPETYKAGDDIKAENIYFIRVSPVNAEVDAANLKLMNSLGEDLSEFVNIKAEAYNELLTRSAETGIWKVTVTLKDGVDRAELQKATNAVLSRDKKKTVTAAVYAFAIGNTEDADATRYAVTSYDLKALTNEYTAGTVLDFTVNDTDVKAIHNRWFLNQNNGKYYIMAEDESMEKDSTYFELAWQTAAAAKKGGFSVPAVKAVTNVAFDADGKALNNYVYDENDVRQGEAMLQVQPEEQIVIKFNKDFYPQIDRYYVQFEKDNAIESAPSEYESWLSYNVTGLSTMKKVSERLILTVPSDAAEGDVIGFRVYAVNYDGTLVDPDGKAFYVQVGYVPNAKESDILAGTFTARYADTTTDAKAVVEDKANSTIIDFNILENYKLAKGTKLAAAGFADEVAVKTTTGDNKARLSEGTTVKIYYLTSKDLDDDNAAQTSTDVDKIKYIGLEIKNPENVVDETTIETEPLKIVDPDKHDKVLGYISFMLTKGEIKQVTNAKVANNDGKIQWKSGQDGNFYPEFNNADADYWKTLQQGPLANIKLTDYATGLDAYKDRTIYDWKIDVTDFSAKQISEYKGIFGADKVPGESALALTPDEGNITGFAVTVPTGMVWKEKTATITISDKTAGESLSRVAKEEYKDKEITDANAQTELAEAKPHVYQTLELTFHDVVGSQAYDWSLTYNAGAVGAAPTKTIAPLFVKYSGADQKLYSQLKADATVNEGKVTVAAILDYTTGTEARQVKLGTLYATSKNSGYEPF